MRREKHRSYEEELQILATSDIEEKKKRTSAY